MQVQHMLCAPFLILIGKVNGNASGTASGVAKKTLLSPPPIINGKAGGKVRVPTRCITRARKLRTICEKVSPTSLSSTITSNVRAVPD